MQVIHKGICMIIHSRNRHEFAIFFPLSGCNAGNFIITDPDLVHRISHVLRVEKGQSILLFDQKKSARFVCLQFSKKELQGTLETLQSHAQHTLAITVLLPVLKREALEEAVYGLTECGVSEIQLVLTDKMQRKWNGAREKERLERIIIAAAEQSKHFKIPNIKEPIGLFQAVTSLTIPLISADVEGQPYKHVPLSQIAVLVGPEADFSEKEQLLIKEKSAQLIRLTPTVLRAQQAAVVMVGMLQSLA